MKKIFSLLLIILLDQSAKSQFFTTQPSTYQLQIQFNKNIEFFGFAFFLGELGEKYDGNDEAYSNGIKKKDWYAYDLSLYRQYSRFKHTENLKLIIKYTENLQANDLIRLLTQVSDFPNATIADTMLKENYIAFSANGDSVTARTNATIFIKTLNQFYQEINFATYFTHNHLYYEHAINEIKANLPPQGIIPAMEKFYRRKFLSYNLLPSLTIPPGMGFAYSERNRKGEKHIYNVFGPFTYQNSGYETKLNPGFAGKQQLQELSVHEFGHSFVNAVINNLPAELIKASAPLFEPIKSNMVDQGYDNWKTCLYEHFVRAGEVIIASDLGKKAEADEMKANYMNDRKFIYLPVILNELITYSTDQNESYQEAIKRALIKLSQLVKLDSITKQERKFTGDPRKATFHTEDIFNFWKAFDKMYPEISGNFLQQNYLDQGSIGLHGFLKNRIENGKSLANILKLNLTYYLSIRESSLTIIERNEQFYSCFEHLRKIYPEAVFPDVYFVIGAKNSAGTAFDQGLIIGAEMFGKADNVLKPVIDIDDIDKIVSHELIHFQQNYQPDKTLLAQCIREGAADFIGELISGAHINKPAYDYGNLNSKNLWDEFVTRMDGNSWTNWLYYSADKSRPKDLGYWMGYKITKAYYDRTADKTKAIMDILNIKDFKQFLVSSNYNGY